MGSTPESVVKQVVKGILNEYKAYYYMPVPTGLGRTSLDFIGCSKGRFFGIETKGDESKKPTLRQETVMKAITAAGGAVFVIKSKDSAVLKTLRLWLAGGPP